MTTTSCTGVHPWSRTALRAFAPGPLALGMRAHVDPSAWLLIWAKRYVTAHREATR